MEADNFGDWRIAAVTTLAKDVPAAYPGGPTHKVGAPVYLASSTKDPIHNVIGFITPSPTALALNSALDNSSKARALRETLALESVVTPWGDGKSVAKENLRHLYDFFEHSMIAVIASFLSLEMSCNEMISRELKGTFEIKRNKQIVTLAPDELERKASTDEKLGDILPKLLAIQTPKGTKLWERYLELEAARDATVHFKSSETKNRPDIDRESLFFQIFRRDSVDFPKTACEIIQYFYGSKVLPRWLLFANEKLSLISTD